MKSFNGHIAALTFTALLILPGIALAQAQPIVSVARLVPLNITGRYVVPTIRPATNPARNHLLTADPFKGISADAVAPVIAGPRLSATCAVALICP